MAAFVRFSCECSLFGGLECGVFVKSGGSEVTSMRIVAGRGAYRRVNEWVFWSDSGALSRFGAVVGVFGVEKRADGCVRVQALRLHEVIPGDCNA